MMSNNSSYEETSTDDYNSFENDEFDEEEFAAVLESKAFSSGSVSSVQYSSLHQPSAASLDSRKRLNSRNSSDSTNARGAVRKRKCRTTFTKNQLVVLEQEFLKYNFISNDKVDALVDMTGLDARIIKNWFKNKRSRVVTDPAALSNSSTLQKPLSATSSTSSLPIITPPVLSSNSAYISPALSSSGIEPVGNFAHTAYPNHMVVVYTNNPNNGAHNNPCQIELSNKNLSSLVDIVNSIGGEENFSIPGETPISNTFIPIQQQPTLNLQIAHATNTSKSNETKKNKKPKVGAIDEVRKFKDSESVEVNYCLNCQRVKHDLCTCNISKVALNRLYRNYYSDFTNNALHFNGSHGNVSSYQASDSNNYALSFSSSKNRPFQSQPIFYKTDHAWPARIYSSSNENASRFVSYYDNENERLIQVL